MDLYVGTFTDEDSKGIYKYRFNTETGVISNGILTIESENPTFLTYSSNRNYLYAVNRSPDKSKPDYVTAYKVNNDDSLSILNTVNSHGKGPCYIALNESGTKIAITTYLGGTVSIYNLNKDGSLNDASQTFNHNSKSQKSHAHSAHFYKEDLLIPDLGRNSVYQYQLEGGRYILKSSAIIKNQEYIGPRHLTMTKDGEYIYVINEHGSSITSIKKTKQGFKHIDDNSTLNENFKGENSCADIHLSKDEKFLYGSNRGENSIVVFKRNKETGVIKKIQSTSSHGNFPRNFALDPTGKFLLVANRLSNNISVFKINSNTGTLSFLHDTKSPTPVCLLF